MSPWFYVLITVTLSLLLFIIYRFTRWFIRMEKMQKRTKKHRNNLKIGDLVVYPVKGVITGIDGDRIIIHAVIRRDILYFESEPPL